MALNKQSINLSFSQGLDTKSDPFQIQFGKFLSLENSIFDKIGRLTKRNGYQKLTSLPDTTSKFVTTFNNNLTAIGTSLNAFSEGSSQWINKGQLQPIDLSVLPVVRSNTNQSYADSSIAANGLMCVVYTDNLPSGIVYKYVVVDSTTGQNIVAPTAIPSADPTFGTPKVFLLGNYFTLLYTRLITASYHLSFITISTSNPSIVSTPVDIASSYIPSTTTNFDAYVAGGKLFIAYNTTAGGQSIKVTYLTQSLTLVTPVTFVGEIATMFSMTADNTSPNNPIVYISYFNLPTTTTKVLAVAQNLGTILAPTVVDTVKTVLNLTSAGHTGLVSIYREIDNNYSYDSAIPTHYIDTTDVTQSGSVGSISVMVRSVGLASKAFTINDTDYMLTVYSSTFQPSYFLVKESGQVVSKLAYSNAGGYALTGLPNAIASQTDANIIKTPYLFKDLVQAINKTQGITNSAGVYAQLGVNIATFNFGLDNITVSEIGSNLLISGGFITAYDGVSPVEQEFFVWPDSVEATGTTGGSMAAQQYFYQVTYEWGDNQGNLYRSAPSIPVGVNLATNAVTLNIPTLRLTYKIASPVKIVIYRWSAAQQIYYQVTSITSPLLNDPTVDSVSYTDLLADSAITGNNIIYTTGGVLEDISPPASNLLTLFNNRLWLVDAEDRNLLWFSKQVIESTPVEMSDLLTLFVAPTTGSEGSTGDITAIAPMDDKLVVFKQNALGYISGVGPDNTGANNQYSDFTLITSVVGCTNQNSIVFMPNGLMFQSSKGIWLLGRDLSTNYIGAPVESLTTGATVQSAVNIPMTNQVRFTLDTGITLMYDYYYDQWGTFSNVPAISATIYQNLHTYINSLGQVFQESPGQYLDNTSPVLMSFKTGWINLVAGVQGFQRFYQAYMLGTWLTPFKLNVQLAYNYNSSNSQSIIITPEQSPSFWGQEQLWGNGQTWGSALDGNVFESRFFPQVQKCESFQVTLNEMYDSSFGVAAGAGLTLSGINLIIGALRNRRLSPASRNFG